MNEKQVMVVGASGVIGNSAVTHFLDQGWDVLALSRRPPDAPASEKLTHLSVDLLDAESCRQMVSLLPGATPVVYSALFEKPGLVAGWREADQMATNLQMLENLLDPMIADGKLGRLILLQGTKAYGSHLHDIRIPSKESEPRDAHESFYWLQEDYVRSKAKSDGVEFTIFRPQITIGGAIGVAMNLVPIIGIYGLMCRELDRPCGFPGGPAFVWEAVDSRIIARAFEWALETDASQGETYNLTNGDVFSWRDLWPGMMKTLGVEPGPDEPVPLSQWLPEHETLWNEMVKRYDLTPFKLKDVLGEAHFNADYCFNYGQDKPTRPKFISTIKVRHAGFVDCIDTEESFRYWLTDLVDRSILPGPVKK